MYQSTKTFGHDFGLSCTFRQHRATSHCRFLHGYALSVKLTFAAFDLDSRNWVVDFGSFTVIKEWLKSWFDHTTLVAKDDPAMQHFREMAEVRLINLREVDATGCEAFARMIFKKVDLWLQETAPDPLRVNLVSVEVSEHAGNSALAFLDVGTQVEF